MIQPTPEGFSDNPVAAEMLHAMVRYDEYANVSSDIQNVVLAVAKNCLSIPPERILDEARKLDAINSPYLESSERIGGPAGGKLLYIYNQQLTNPSPPFRRKPAFAEEAARRFVQEQYAMRRFTHSYAGSICQTAVEYDDLRLSDPFRQGLLLTGHLIRELRPAPSWVNKAG